MKANHVVQTVCSIISEVCGVDAKQIGPDVRLAAYGFDSIRAINLLLALEEAFSISIPDEVAPRVRTMREVVSYLEERLGITAAPAPERELAGP